MHTRTTSSSAHLPHDSQDAAKATAVFTAIAGPTTRYVHNGNAAHPHGLQRQSRHRRTAQSRVEQHIHHAGALRCYARVRCNGHLKVDSHGGNHAVQLRDRGRRPLHHATAVIAAPRLVATDGGWTGTAASGVDTRRASCDSSHRRQCWAAAETAPTGRGRNAGKRREHGIRNAY